MYKKILENNLIINKTSGFNSKIIEKIFNESINLHINTEICILESLILLIAISIIIYVIAKKINISYTLALMSSGIILSFIGLIPKIELTHDLLVMVFLPALLFEAALHFSANELKQYASTIVILAVPVVFLTAITIAIVLNLEIKTLGLYNNLLFTHLLLFGTLISATDPISVITLFKQLGVNKKLTTIIEGESLFNDASAIVLFTATLQIIKSEQIEIFNSILKLITVISGGIVIGIFSGIICNYLITIFRKDKIICIATTIATTYISYIMAEKINGSGILAAVISGLFVGNLNKKKDININTRISIMSFWEYMIFFIISIIFIMMGLEVNINTLIKEISLTIISFITVIMSRALSIIISIPFLKKIGQVLDLKSSIIILWGGLRGALSMVLVLALDETISNRNLLINMTFGVVMLSVLIQGSTMEMLLKKLNFISNKTNLSILLNKMIAKLYMIKKQQKSIKNLNKIDKIISKGLIIKIKKEKKKILTVIKNIKKDPGYIKAINNRINLLDSYINKLALESYDKIIKKGLITKDEINELLTEKNKE